MASKYRNAISTIAISLLRPDVTISHQILPGCLDLGRVGAAGDGE